MSHFIIRSPLTKEVPENWIKTKVEVGLVEQFIITIKDSGKEIGSVYFKDIDHIASSFDKFAKLLPDDGLLVAYAANPFVNQVMKNAKNLMVLYLS